MCVHSHLLLCGILRQGLYQRYGAQRPHGAQNGGPHNVFHLKSAQEPLLICLLLFFGMSHKVTKTGNVCKKCVWNFVPLLLGRGIAADTHHRKCVSFSQSDIALNFGILEHSSREIRWTMACSKAVEASQ